MKRLIFVASLAILAASCQKTEIQNEVQTPISFSTETGKQTRAIMADEYAGHTFGVYSYAYDKKEDGTFDPKDFMSNIQIGIKEDDAWKAGSAYYWPNDPDNYLNFYAYSPYYKADVSLAADKTLHFDANNTAAGISHSEADGLKLTAYTHTNMYVDFMVATPVYNATYTNQNGGETTDANTASVPVVFHHEMTQIIFNVKTDDTYDNITFTLNDITMNNIVDKADYTNTTLIPGQTPTFAVTNAWTKKSSVGEYRIFPATTNVSEVNAAPAILNDDINGDEVEDEKEITSGAFSTTPVTMIPQELKASTPASGNNPAVYGQSFTIKYTIVGNGELTETVEQTIEFVTANIDWTANKKITYNVVVGLHEITFDPDVENWGDNEHIYYIPETIKPTTPSTSNESNEE